MRILVTGGAGYIGSHAAKALARAGYEPIVLDNFSTRHRDAVKWGPHAHADLADADAIRKLPATYKVHAAIYFAASDFVGESIDHPRKSFRNNVHRDLVAKNVRLKALRTASHSLFSIGKTRAGECPLPISANSPGAALLARTSLRTGHPWQRQREGGRWSPASSGKWRNTAAYSGCWITRRGRRRSWFSILTGFW